MNKVGNDASFKLSERPRSLFVFIRYPTPQRRLEGPLQQNCFRNGAFLCASPVYWVRTQKSSSPIEEPARILHLNSSSLESLFDCQFCQYSSHVRSDVFGRNFTQMKFLAKER